MAPEIESKLKRDITALFKIGWNVGKIVDTLAKPYGRHEGGTREFIKTTALAVGAEINSVTKAEAAKFLQEIRESIGEAAHLTGMRITLR